MICDLVGKPFESGGRGPDSYDCIGIVIEVYKRNGIILNDFSIGAFCYSKAQEIIESEIKSGKWIKCEEPEYLSVVIMKQHPIFTQHIGVNVDCGRFIHASIVKGVTIDRLIDPSYKNSIKGFYKYVV